MINLIHGDCMEYMATLKDNEFDLAVVDPPYGLDADQKNNGPNSDRHRETSLAKINIYKNTKWDSNVPQREYFEELMRVSKRQIIWGVNYYPYNFFTGGRIYWDKGVTMPTYSKGEIAFCSFIKSVQSFSYQWHGMLQGDMKNKQKRIHPTQKPIQLYQWIFDKYAQKGWRILDTHLGSGSSAIAAHDCGLEFVGIELDGDYFHAAKERLETHQRQLTFPW